MMHNLSNTLADVLPILLLTQDNTRWPESSKVSQRLNFDRVQIQFSFMTNCSKRSS